MATLNVTETWLTLVTCIILWVTYPSMLTSFTTAYLYNLSVIIDNTILPKMNISWKMKPQIFVYAPLELGGIGYPNDGLIQDQEGTGHFFKHLQWGKELTTDHCILLPEAQLQSGLFTPLMDDTTTGIPYLEKEWISHLCGCLHELGGSIWIENSWISVEDEAIMEAFLKVKQKRALKPNLVMVNIYRIWLRALRS